MEDFLAGIGGHEGGLGSLGYTNTPPPKRGAKDAADDRDAYMWKLFEEYENAFKERASTPADK